MLKSNLVVKTFSLPIYPDYHILNSYRSIVGVKRTVMIPINEEEEETIDNIGKQRIKFIRGNREYAITMKDIYCYGEIDFNDENTLEQIRDFKFLDYLDTVGIYIRNNYDYNTHSFSFTDKHRIWTQTFNPLDLVKLAHGYLGKPKRILLFNHTIK